MDDEPIDFGALDPSRDTVRWEGMIRGISERAAPALARRAAERNVFVLVADWARPALAAAAALAAVSAGALAWELGDPASAPLAGVEEALQLAEPVSLWVAEERAPTTSDLIAAVEDLP